MDNMQINGIVLMDMILAGVNKLNKEKAAIDSLNVFPVPDGDTGTNMSLTLNSVSKFLGQIPKDNITVDKVAKQMSYGALMGARGNSGVILSQILGGIGKVLQQKGDTVTPKDMVDAFASGVESAYKAVVKPMEGTILTVCREASAYLTEVYQDDYSIEQCLRVYLEEGYRSLNRTPEMLPVLKQAGVVDAGAKGLLTIIEGMLDGLTGKIDVTAEKTEQTSSADHYPEFHIDAENIVFQYCTEMIVHNREKKPLDAEAAREYLGQIGDCVLVVSTDEITKVHVHTNNPGKALEYFCAFGDLNDIKIENMKAQSQEFAPQADKTQERRAMAVVAVSAGEGLSEIFTGLQVDYLITGGQTMNPSTEEFLSAIEQVNADNVILLPNNKNIILAAEQAAKMAEGANVRVVPSRSIPQGIAAMMAYNSEADLDELVEEMQESVKAVKSGEVTYAVRDTMMEDLEIKEGQLLGIVEGKIAVVGDEMTELIKQTLEAMETADKELVTLYYGEDVQDEEAEELLAVLEETFLDQEFEVYAGKQAVYAYLISVE